MNYNISKLAENNPDLATELKSKCYKVLNHASGCEKWGEIG